MGAAAFRRSLEGPSARVLWLVVSIGAVITVEETHLQGVTTVMLALLFTAVKNLSEAAASPPFLPPPNGDALCLAQGRMQIAAACLVIALVG